MKVLVIGLFLLLSWSTAQTDFSGVYITQGRAGDVVLTLEQTADQVTGTIAGKGTTYNLFGTTGENDAVTGFFESEEEATFAFTFGDSPEEFIFTLTDKKGLQNFIFTRQGDAPTITDTNSELDETQDVWTGLFNNEEATRGLKIDTANNGEYTGSLIIDGFEYPFTATGDEANLTGNYVVGGDALVPFTVSKDGDTVTLEFPDNPESNAVLTRAF